MKVVVAIDSFKGSMSSVQAGNAVAKGIKESKPDAEVVVLPVADGGEGTTDALISGLAGIETEINVTGPLGKSVTAKYGIINNLAVMEMAQAAGLTLVPPEKRNPMKTTTFGLGEMILDAADKGCNEFIIGIGGSATNDCGIGMLQALGFSFLDKNNNEIPTGAKGISSICSISDANVSEKIKNCSFRIACDVSNPLCGKNGCSHIFAPQKGASAEDIAIMDKALEQFSNLTKKYYTNADPSFPGSGAAGGLGFAFRTFLNASLEPGVQIVLDAIDLDKHVQAADYVITGEGRMDSQTIMGKAPIGIAKAAKKYNKRVIALCGSISDDITVCNEYGIDAIFSITKGPCSLENAMLPENAANNISSISKQLFRLL